ncbi:hypothetical protein VB796_08600 [Arcicella sp. LKC2W]|uniref:hypothetical protein n=1 Tax=Arcicella sp. LKC2W TaxID=2984198 RepID=UPI002B20C09C|nr:hypothetical protein [Arcicella sp. LKC2W]MEA5459093.1 hypothetical protein [Arcicella sp. LKC2W]
MPNYRLQIGQTSIFLPPNFGTTLRIQNPYMSIELVGDFSFQFTIPKDENSTKVFGNVNMPNVGIQSTQSYRCQLYADDFVIFDGYCNLRKALNFSYSIDLSKTPGNVQKSILDEKVNSIDFGQYKIPTSQVITGIWTIADDSITQDKKFSDSFNIGHVKITVTVDNVIVIQSERRIKLSGEIVNDWDSKRTTYNDSQQNLSVIDSEQNLHFIFNNTLVHSCKIKIDRYVRGGTEDRPRDIFDSSTEYKAVQVSYQSIGDFPNKTLEATWSEPFFYPFIQNDKAYDSESYSGTFNNNTGAGVTPVRGQTTTTTTNSFYLNTYLQRDYFGLTPAFQLKFIFEKVCKYLGFNIVTDIFNDEDIKSIYLVSSKAQDKQCPATKLPFNIYDETIVYKDYLPDWTIKEFLESFKALTGTGLDFKESESKVYVKLLKDVIKNSNKIDKSQFVGFMIGNNVLYKKKYQVKFAETISDERYNPIPTDDNLKNEESVQTIPIKFIPALTKVRTSTGSDWGINRGQTILPEPIETLMFDQKVNSPIYAQDSESIQHRIFYKKGEKISTNGINLDLRINGEKGVYQKRLKEFLDFLNTIEEYETTIKLNPYQQAAIELDKPIFAYNVDLFIWQIEVKLPLKESCVVRLWRR